MNSTLWRVQISRTARRYPSGGMMIPASPWMGSISTAAVFASIAASIAAASPNGTETNPGANGPKSSRAVGSSLKPTIVVVRPWKLPFATTMVAASGTMPLTRYAHARATLMPVSTASAPVFMGSTRSLPQSRASASANRPELVVVVRPAGERDAPELLGRGGEERRMPVAEVQRRVGGQQVEVALALDIGHPRALGAGDHDRERVVVVRDVLLFGLDDAGGGGVGCHALRSGHWLLLQRRSSSVQHLIPPPPSSSSDRSTRIGL